MLKITVKQYEIEEKIQALNEKKEVEYEFNMQITSDELMRINHIITFHSGVESMKKIDKLMDEGKEAEAEETEAGLLDTAKQFENEFADICFKEHKQPFIEKCGEYKYQEMLDLMFSFFWNAFLEKKAEQINTINSSLQKLIQK